MYMRLIEVTGRNFDRADLDDVTDSLKAQFWRDVATVYCPNDDKFKGFIEYDADSDGIDPGTIVPHSPAKLEEMWMELTSFFSISEANFRLSGTHDHEFKRFVQGKLDVLYLGYWLKERPQALSSVKGGMYEEGEFDSLSSFTPTREHRRATQASEVPAGSERVLTRSPKQLLKKKTKTHSDSTDDVLVTLVGRIAAAREAEITLAREQDQEATARVRAEYYKMLDDIRKRISAIESEMSSAASPIKLRLQVDLDFFLEERQMIMDALREQNL
ncbi:hypothetical protein F442_07582 [Phytophthora nicotianae P10297]|uniref:No apical meristem-associated C-terminal domain-containing protein n=6 Tax=Phytophthora nicotianae TaxID=4792 RepID=V9FDD2_PHYNI|nr:hypothetical protein F443_07576 [Phytophthora nicotianae P1569]ETL94891.1 hypothetical protein L917_07230 [Phytophthora nicotianae]ETM48131.1 hypothetical protein L914_07288 [Phytophthora nicotianae]ETO77183.1 hypothetical protein F444_07585 [Phytophthora nicotianae P1976]ETP46130.1 hypothetical protein F442_07582 [Phytophthora nicotianae P10297]